MATVSQLLDELKTQVQGIPGLFGAGRAITVHDFDEIDPLANSGMLQGAMVFFRYEGMEPTGREGNPQQGRSFPAAVTYAAEFSIIITHENRVLSQDSDTKSVITDALDSIRSVLLGFVGVNKRPWRLLREGPIDEIEHDTLIFYGSGWATDVTFISNPS